MNKRAPMRFRIAITVAFAILAARFTWHRLMD